MKGIVLILGVWCLCESLLVAGQLTLGIITIPSDVSEYDPKLWSYFPSSYVKFIESGGAQVVPIQYDLPRENLTYLLERVNGVLLTGGGSAFLDDQGNPTPIVLSIQFIVDYIINENRNGNYYPLWGTCQGFQVIAMALTHNYSILSNCTRCIDVNKNNIFNGDYKSKLFASLPEDLHEKMAGSNISYFWHHYKLDISAFQDHNLSSMVTPVTYSIDEAGVKYVSSLESPDLPIYATQFHQEISTFEWIDDVANHGLDAVRLQQYLANFVVNEARKNRNTFPDVQGYLIDSFSATVMLSSGFTSMYMFPALDHHHDLITN